MSLPVAYLPEARDDVDVAYTQYESRSPGLGDQLLEALRERLAQIADSPELYGVVHQDVRAAPLRQFPYVVYYRAETDRVLVIAVQHGRRKSSTWQGRV